MPSVSRGLYRWIFRRPAVLEDFADRLNHYWTVALLFLLASIISWKQGYSEPMVCWCPAHFTKPFIEYTHSTCWHSYFIQYAENVEKAMEIMNHNDTLDVLPFSFPNFPIVSSSVPGENDELSRFSSTTTLYQWLPLILCFQALLFKLPNIILYVFHGFAGISFDKIAGLTTGYEQMNSEERRNLGRQISRYILRWCRSLENLPPWRLLTLFWIVVKVLYCVNVIVQLCVLNSYLVPGPPLDNSTSYGEIISGNVFDNNATTWNESPTFPKEVMCNFNVPQLSNIHMYTVKCHLPGNVFNERAYMFLWVWFVFVAVVTSLSFAIWLITTFLPFMRKRYIARALETGDGFDLVDYSPSDFERFCHVIGEDGVMALKLTSSNSSEFVVCDVVCNMFNEWRGKVCTRTGNENVADVEKAERLYPEIKKAD